MESISNKPDLNKTYILGNTITNDLLCTAKFNEKGDITNTNYDNTPLFGVNFGNIMKMTAQWIVTSGDCTLPGDPEKKRYLLVEQDSK